MRHEATFHWSPSIHAKKPELTPKTCAILDEIVTRRGRGIPRDMLIFEFAFLTAQFIGDAARVVDLYIEERSRHLPKCRLCNQPKPDDKLPMCGDCRHRVTLAANARGLSFSQGGG